MFLVFTNLLNPNEIIILEKLLKLVGVLPYKICRGEKEFPDKAVALKHTPILVFDPTKGKPALKKKLETAYGKEFLNDEVTEIPRPLTFVKDKELEEIVWEKLKILRQKVDVKEVYFSLIPKDLPDDLIKILMNKGNRPVYYFNVGNQILELRPGELNASQENSLTYEEFTVLLSAKFVFNFDRVEILSTT